MARTVVAAASGKAAFQDFHFSMATEQGIAEARCACATGKHIPSAMLTCRKAGGSQIEFLKIKLADVPRLVVPDGGTTAGPRPPFPQDQFSLNFAKIDFLYTVDRTGETSEAEFDVRANTEG